MKFIVINDGSAKDLSFIRDLKVSGYCEMPIQYNVLTYFINNIIDEMNTNELEIDITFGSHKHCIKVKDIIYQS